MNNWEILCEEYNQHKGEIVLFGTKIYRLVGLIETEEDYYWRMVDFFGDSSFLSCVGSPIYLRDFLLEQDYNCTYNNFTVHFVEAKDPISLN